MISIVLCTYNGERYIEEQLQSLLDQSLQPDEVLIFDDGSTDATGEICCGFIQEHHLSGWTYIVNEHNLGWANNFMQNFSRAEGDIIFPCDQDDIWEKTKIEKMTSILSGNPDIELLVGRYRKMIQNGDDIKIDYSGNFTGKVSAIPFDEKMLFIDYPGCVFAFRKTLLDKIRPYSFDRYPHDALLIRMSRLFGTAYVYDEPVILFRRHGDNASGTPIREAEGMVERIEYYIHCLQEMQRYCEEHSGYDSQKALIEKNIRFYKTRLKAFSNRKIFGKDGLLSCMRYIRFYPEPKSFLGDMYRILH